ncbi:sugar ABC transporter permease [Devosia sp. XK-2]|uniref:carbohydrate ABC transporter permease n=1 Tax=Devosia sp. XK-2 TaxID=3126689 RepID=UPI0030CD51DC
MKRLTIPLAPIALLPALLGLALFRVYPIVLAVFESLFSTFRGERLFVGFENYILLLTDNGFWQSLWVTLWFNLIINPLQVALALLLALMFVQKVPFIGIFRFLFLIPIGVSLPVAVIIWRIMLLPDGLLNGFLGALGLPPLRFLTSPELALYSIIAIATWKGISYWMIFIIGGLQNISPEIHEAARLEGASSWQRLWLVTLPLLKPTLLFVLVADVTINFLLFAPIFMLTNGGPRNSTNVLMYEAYKSGFVFGDMGRAMAIVVILVALLLVIVGLQFWLLSGRRQGAAS